MVAAVGWQVPACAGGAWPCRLGSGLPCTLLGYF